MRTIKLYLWLIQAYAKVKIINLDGSNNLNSEYFLVKHQKIENS